MEKKLLAIIFVIGMIVYAIIQAIPFILGGAIIAGIIYLLIRLYMQYPEAYCTWGAKLIMPLLIIGWIYVGYLGYTNLVYNTYYIEPGGSDGIPWPCYKITAIDDKEAIVKAWDEYIRRNKEKIDAGEFSYRYKYEGEKVRIHNHTNDEIIQFYRYEDVYKSLNYKHINENYKLDDFFCTY